MSDSIASSWERVDDWLTRNAPPLARSRRRKGRGGRSSIVAIVLGASSAFLGGCKVGPDYEPPKPWTWTGTEVEVDAPEAGAAGIDSSQPVAADWWHQLKDPMLDGLVKQGIE